MLNRPQFESYGPRKLAGGAHKVASFLERAAELGVGKAFIEPAAVFLDHRFGFRGVFDERHHGALLKSKRLNEPHILPTSGGNRQTASHG